MKVMLDQEIDLHSSAGFRLGQKLADFDTSEIHEWNPIIDGQLSQAISQNSEWLLYEYKLDFIEPTYVVDLFYANEVIHLQFRNGILELISVGGGYKGAFQEFLKIGTSIENLKTFFELKYDDIEEIYFFNDPKFRGIAFFLNNQNCVSGIVVHSQLIHYE